MGEIHFRPANPGDAQLWAVTQQKAWAATYRSIYPDACIDHYDYPKKEGQDHRNLSDPEISSYLVMDGAQCAGYFSYGPTSAGEFYLKSLYILPPYQGRGLGREIFRQLRADCSGLGFTGFYCHCNQHNLPARDFYVHMGGRLVCIDGGHANRAEDQCRYEFDLTEYTANEKGETPCLPKPR